MLEASLISPSLRKGEIKRWQKALADHLLVKKYLAAAILLGFSIFCPTLLAFLFGVSGKICAKFFLYAFVYHGLNGFLLISLFKQSIPESLKFPTILVSGIGYNILTFFILSLFNWQAYSFLNVFFLLFLKIFYDFDLIRFKPQNIRSVTANSLVIFLLSLTVFFGCVTFILPSVVETHLGIQAVFTKPLLSNPYPYFLFWLPEIPFYYNYGYHIETAFCFFLTSIPLEILHVRLYPLYTFFLLIFTTYFFCRAHFQGKSITGGLAVLGSLCVIGYNNWSSILFLNVMPSTMTCVGSATVALTIFLILLDRIDNLLKSRDHSYLNYTFLLFMFFIGALSRSAFAPIIIGGVSFLILTEFLKTRKISPLIRLCILNFLLGITFIVTLIVIYGIFSSFSATGMIKFVPQNTQLMFSVIPAWLSSFSPTLAPQYQNLIFALASLISIIFISGYLVIGFYYQLFQWFKNGLSKLDSLLFYCALTGAIIWNFTMSPGQSNYTFYHYSLLIAGILGANGTYLIFRDALRTKSKILFVLVSLCTTALFTKGYEIYYNVSQLYWQSLSFRKTPNYAQIPQEIINSIESVAAKKKNTIVVALIPFNLILNLKLRNVPIYHEPFIQVAKTWNVLSSAELERVTNIINASNEAALLLDDITINKFKVLFPGKEIIFFTLDTQKVTSNQLVFLSKADQWQAFVIK